MNPKHSNPTQKRIGRNNNEFWAHAPYNFVPLPEKVVTVDQVPNQDAYLQNTGYIQCTLKTLSPLYTRCAMRPEFFKENSEKSFHELNESQKTESAQNFSIQGSPVLPGSSLRGLVRSFVEIAGFGKMQWVSNEKLAFRAVGDTTSLGKLYRKQMNPSTIKAGYMHQQGNVWQIIPAKSIKGNSFGRIYCRDADALQGLDKWNQSKNAEKIFVSFSQNNTERQLLVSKAMNHPEAGLQEAVLVKTGKINGKKKDFVFGLPDKESKPIEIAPEMVQTYRNQITSGQESLLGRDGVLREMQPIFYRWEEDALIFFGHAMMFRVPYPKSPFDLIPPDLRDINQMDIADAIFGFIPKDKRISAHAGRVSFTDAKLESTNDDIWLTEGLITPKILASPKQTTFQHYLVQDKAKNHDPDDKERLAHYAPQSSDETVIRGHKVYWHKGTVTLEDIREGDKRKIENAPTQYTRIKPVKAGVTFSFRIYFENLREWELGALLWVLILPGEKGIEYRQKIGMGKPLGMGSVQISPTLHLNDRETRYKSLFEEEQWFEGRIINKPPEEFIKVFEEYVLTRVQPAEKGNASRLWEIPRIRMFLKILEFPGPDPKLTTYMTIEPSNEYKERPVLPDPLNILPLLGIKPAPQKPTNLPQKQPLKKGRNNPVPPEEGKKDQETRQKQKSHRG